MALNDELQLLCDKIQEDNEPTNREAMLLAQIEAMSAVAERKSVSTQINIHSTIVYRKCKTIGST
jgi:ribonuclease HI